MNEKIFELAKMADPDYTGVYNEDMGHALVGSAPIGKFAKLIIQECVDIVEKDAPISAMYVRNHFGVEE